MDTDGAAHLAAPTSTLVTRAIVAVARQVGVDIDTRLRTAGIDEASLTDPHGVVTHELKDRVWAIVDEAVADPAFGLMAARLLERGAFRGLEYAVRASATLGEGLELLVRFDRVLHGQGILSLQGEEDATAVVYHPPAPGRASSADFALATIVVLGADATGRRLVPDRVELAHPAPADPTPFTELFGRPVEFGAPVDRLVLGAALLSTPMREADPVLRDVLAGYIDGELAALPTTFAHATAVRRALPLVLRGGDATLEATARQLGTTARLLRARLTAEGETFSRLRDEVRRALALRYLADPDLSIPGVALLLGYSEARAFHRAFLRWTGRTPGRARADLLGPRAQLSADPTARSLPSGSS